MRKILLLLLLPFWCSAQTPEIKRLLATPDDTTKVQLLMQEAFKLMDADKPAAESLLQQMIAISKRIGYTDGVATSLMNVGYLNVQDGQYRQGIQVFRTAIAEYKKINKLFGIAGCLTNLGSIYELMGERDSGIIYYMEAVRYLEKTTDYRTQALTLSNLGVLLHNAKKYDKALGYKSRGVELARKSKDTVAQIISLSTLSETHSALLQYPMAIGATSEALKLAKAANNLRFLSTAYESLASIYVDLKNADSAIAAARSAIRYAHAASENSNYLKSAITLSQAYNLSGQQQQRIAILNEGLQACLKSGNVLLADDFYEYLADAHYRLGHYKQAYDAYSQFTVYKDSVFNEQNNKTVSELEVKYQTAQKEKTLSEQQLQLVTKDLQLQRSRQYTFYGIGASLIALLVACLVYLDLRNKRKAHTRQLAALQQEKKIQLLQALMQGEEKERSRIAKDLHDGVAGMLSAVKMHFNGLSAQHAQLAGTGSYQQGIRLLDEATSEVRRTSHNLMPELLQAHGLDEALRRNCANISSGTLEVQYDSWGDARRYKSSFELSVYRIVQELLNNIVKHSKAVRAVVQLSQQEGLLSITVEDDGVGFARSKNSSDGMGLHGLRSRVQAMNGKMELEAEPGNGVSAYLEFETSEVELV